MRTVTVGIPSKGRPGMLGRAIDSSIGQTYRGMVETVVIDATGGDSGGDEIKIISPNRTLETVKFRTDPGAFPCWYLSAALGRGEIFHINFDDDWMSPAFLERTIPMLADDVGMVITDGMINFEDASKNRPDMNFMATITGDGNMKSDDLINHILGMEYTISPASAIMRRSDFLECMPVSKVPHADKIMLTGDCFMMLSVMSRYPYVGIVRDPLANYGAHEGSYTIDHITSGKGNKLSDEYRKMKECFRMLRGAL